MEFVNKGTMTNNNQKVMALKSEIARMEESVARKDAAMDEIRTMIGNSRDKVDVALYEQARNDWNHAWKALQALKTELYVLVELGYTGGKNKFVSCSATYYDVDGGEIKIEHGYDMVEYRPDGVEDFA
ncbi:hypothetical protein ACX93W_05395 [Paenibacillus sp. CAU 1782]